MPAEMQLQILRFVFFRQANLIRMTDTMPIIIQLAHDAARQETYSKGLTKSGTGKSEHLSARNLRILASNFSFFRGSMAMEGGVAEQSESSTLKERFLRRGLLCDRDSESTTRT